VAFQPRALCREFAADVATTGAKGKASVRDRVKLSETLAKNFTPPPGAERPEIYRG
jgi:hypothetical protein